jgi:chaperonin GroES
MPYPCRYATLAVGSFGAAWRSGRIQENKNGKKRNDNMKIKPLNDKILVQRIEAEEKTAGGIVLPDKAKEKPKRGKVIAVGPGKILDDGKRQKPEVKKGQEILFASYAGTEVKINNAEYLIMNESDVLAVIEK